MACTSDPPQGERASRDESFDERDLPNVRGQLIAFDEFGCDVLSRQEQKPVDMATRGAA